jgi:cell division protein FtsL
VKQNKTAKQVVEKTSTLSRYKHSLIEYGFATIIIAVVVWFVVNKNMTTTNTEVKNEVQKTNEAVNQLQTRIDSVKAYQETLVERARELELAQQQTIQLIENGNYLLIQNRKALEKIRLENNERINSALSYNHAQLDSFFASRYKGQ